jgi:arabinogalactan oligomer / maltooligosaccharide transport system permease protein
MSALETKPRAGAAKWLFGKRREGSRFSYVLTYLVLVVAVIISVYPVARVVSVSLRPGDRALSADLSLIPKDATLENYRQVIEDKPFLSWVWNSLIITISTSVLGVIIACTSAYAFSRWKFKGRSGMLVFLLATQMIPAVMLMIPIYIFAFRLGLTGSWAGLVFAYSVSSVPFSIWILKGYYDTIPFELEEAASIDGASPMTAFYKIVLPLSSPALAIVFLFNFMTAWNDYLLARIMVSGKESMYTWTLGLRTFADQFSTQWGMYAASALMVSIPVMILFFISSKWLISGLTLGSVKG